MNIAGLKKAAIRESVELLSVVVFLAPFLISFAIFREYLLGESGGRHFSYGTALLTALVNALVLGKIILIGEIAKVGKRSETKPLIVPTIYKAVMFTLLYLVVYLVEDSFRRLFHGQSLIGLLNFRELLALSLVVFFAFIPFFALRETRRILGAEEFRCLFFTRHTGSESFKAPATRPDYTSQ